MALLRHYLYELRAYQGGFDDDDLTCPYIDRKRESCAANNMLATSLLIDNHYDATGSTPEGVTARRLSQESKVS